MKILFIPSYYYLSNNLFNRIGKHLIDKAKLVYLDTKDPVYSRANRDQERNLISDFEVDDLEIEASSKIKFLLEFKKKLLAKVKEISPDRIVFSTDHSLAYQILKAGVPDIQKIVVQPTFLNLDGKVCSWKTVVKSLTASVLLRVPINFTRRFGMNSRDDLLVVWGDISASFYKEKRDKVVIAGNPNYDELFMGELPSEVKKSALLLVDDFSYLGTSFHLNIQESYRRIISTRDDIEWLVRIHPRIKERLQFDLERDNVVDCTEENLDELVNRCGFTLSTYSNVAVSGIIKNKPALFYCPKEQDAFKRWFPGQIDLAAKSFEELNLLVELILSPTGLAGYGEKRSEYLNGLLGDDPANSSKRISELIMR